MKGLIEDALAFCSVNSVVSARNCTEITKFDKKVKISEKKQLVCHNLSPKIENKIFQPQLIFRYLKLKNFFQ